MKSCIQCYGLKIVEDPEEMLCDECYYKDKLFNLLAIIHRDNGEYTKEHGLEKSVEDAKKEIINMGIELEGQQGMI